MNNLSLRIVSAAVIIPPLLAILFLAPAWGFALAAISAAGIAGWEFGNVAFGRAYPAHRFLLAGVSAAIAATIAFQNWLPILPMVSLIVTIPLMLTVFMLSAKDMKEAATASAFASMGALYTGGLFGSMALLTSSVENGRLWFFTLLAATIFNDTFAYAVGRLFGKRPLAISLSPKKTRAGAVGGILGALGAVAVMKILFFPDIPLWKVPIIGISLSVACQVGDLAESFIKRAFDVKDSGHIIPGHGGILDRCDALMFAAPVMLLFALTNGQ